MGRRHQHRYLGPVQVRSKRDRLPPTGDSGSRALLVHKTGGLDRRLYPVHPARNRQQTMPSPRSRNARVHTLSKAPAGSRRLGGGAPVGPPASKLATCYAVWVAPPPPPPPPPRNGGCKLTPTRNFKMQHAHIHTRSRTGTTHNVVCITHVPNAGTTRAVQQSVELSKQNHNNLHR